jgi:hypothetical protein
VNAASPNLKRWRTGLIAAVLALSRVIPTPDLFAAAENPPPRLGAGAVFETLTVGPSTYHDVKVRSVNARSVMISHAGGLAALRLRDLPPELQQAFGYSAEGEALADAKARADQVNQQKRINEEATKRAAKATATHSAPFEQLVQKFGRPAELQPLVDLRPKFFELSLNAKNQGPRPSCAIFAIVSSLEYQNALLTGRPERFSEEYLLWATCKTLNRMPRPRADSAAELTTGANAEDFDDADEGFALSEVVTALRGYGVPLQDSLPYSFDRTSVLKDPPPNVIDQARNRRHVAVLPLPGHDLSTVLTNLIHSLNTGIPVAVGMGWPPSRALRGGNYLNAQKPREGSGHAVTVVGYENKTGAIADTVFIFKNSWGTKWGAAGYGYVSYRYLFNNLHDTAVLDVALGKG